MKESPYNLLKTTLKNDIQARQSFWDGGSIKWGEVEIIVSFLRKK